MPDSNDIISFEIDLLRLDASTKRRILKLLGKLERDLAAELTVETLTDFRRQRLNALLKQARETIAKAYDEIDAVSRETLEAVAELSAEQTAASMATVTAIAPQLPPAGFLDTLTSKSLIEGATSSEWWSRQKRSTQNKFSDAVRQGVAQGEDNQKIIKRILGRGGFPATVSKANMATLVHASRQRVANDARFETFRRNAFVLDGVQQISTLDGKTTDICIAYSGAKWDLEGNPIRGTKLPFNGGPPRHWGCRSKLLGIIKDKFKPKVARTTRTSVDGQIRADTTFKEWLESRTIEQQNEQLGVGRAQLWRDGKITLRQLLDQDGNPLTLTELREKLKKK